MRKKGEIPPRFIGATCPILGQCPGLALGYDTLYSGCPNRNKIEAKNQQACSEFLYFGEFILF